MSVDEYLAAGRGVSVPRLGCPDCGRPMAFRSGYERAVRTAGPCRLAWVRRGECGRCRRSHALLPSFLLVGRLDEVAKVGGVIAAVAGGQSGVRPAASAADVPHSTARDWVRRFCGRAPVLASGLASLAVELGRLPGRSRPPTDPPARAMAALRDAWAAAVGRSGLLATPLWAFASLVTGGRMIGTARDPLWFVIGGRRFMPPVP